MIIDTSNRYAAGATADPHDADGPAPQAVAVEPAPHAEHTDVAHADQPAAAPTTVSPSASAPAPAHNSAPPSSDSAPASAPTSDASGGAAWPDGHCDPVRQEQLVQKAQNAAGRAERHAEAAEQTGVIPAAPDSGPTTASPQAVKEVKQHDDAAAQARDDAVQAKNDLIKEGASAEAIATADAAVARADQAVARANDALSGLMLNLMSSFGAMTMATGKTDIDLGFEYSDADAAHHEKVFSLDELIHAAMYVQHATSSEASAVPATPAASTGTGH